MKRFLITVLTVLTVLTVSVSAEPLLIMPSPDATAEAEKTPEELEREALLESLVKGIVPVKEGLSLEDFISYLSIIDESDNKLITSKFNTLVQVIAHYHYGNKTADQVFELFTKTVDSVDINNMDETYKKLFSMMDKFSYYLTPEEAEEFFSPASARGIGIRMVWKDAEEGIEAGIYVDEVAAGSPAEDAGIAAGDRIVEFNGNNMRGLGFEALNVYNSMVPEDAETLTVTMKRGETETEYILNRKQNVFSEFSVTLYPEKGLIYLDINSFMYADTVKGISDKLDELYPKGYRNIIIDLQGNSGGDLYIASEIISKFTPVPEVMFYMGRDGRTNTVPFVSRGNGYKFDKISILVDGITASSAEIMSDTLRKIAGAQIIGSQTFGKGVAQSVFTFEDDVAVGITSYVAYDRYGKTYNEIGLKPDSTVIPKIERNVLPDKTPSFTALNYTKAAEGAENSTVRGLEIRLEAIGFLSESAVDGIWDETTTNAIKALRLSLDMTPDGGLDEELFNAITDLVRRYKNSYYLTYTPFDYAYRFFEYK